MHNLNKNEQMALAYVVWDIILLIYRPDFSC